jgi:hypothetical protein
MRSRTCTGSAPRGTSTAAAIATVAHGVLVTRVSTQQAMLDAEYDQYLAAVPDGRAGRAGVALGAGRGPGLALVRPRRSERHGAVPRTGMDKHANAEPRQR